MKKIITLITLLFSLSCSYNNQNLDLKLTLNDKFTQENKRYEITTSVVDLRKKPEIVGRKHYYKQSVSLLAKKPIANLLKESIDKNLKSRGFKVGNLRYLELQILELNYDTKKGIFVGTSKGEAKIKAVIKNYNATKIFEKTFNVSVGRKHVIISDLATDKTIIENLISEIASDILEDSSINEQITK